jgi:hypothetical protein
LPSGLSFLSLGDGFNETVDNLPAGLQELRLLTPFNQPVNNLPGSLTILWIHSLLFRHKIERLPVSILTVSLSRYLPDNLFELLPNIQDLKMYHGYREPKVRRKVDVKSLTKEEKILLKEQMKALNNIYAFFGLH